MTYHDHPNALTFTGMVMQLSLLMADLLNLPSFSLTLAILLRPV